MFRRLAILSFIVFSGIFLYITSSPVAAQSQLTAEMQQCLKSVSDFTGNCANYINNSVIPCLRRNDTQSNTWACNDQNLDGSVDATDIRTCAQSFPNTVCNNIEGITGIGGVGWRNCRDQCKLQSNGYIYSMQDLFKEKAYARYSVTPPVDNVENSDSCLKAVNKKAGCGFVISTLTSCYEGVPPWHALWSCTKADGTEASKSECKTLFVQRIEAVLNQVTGVSSINDVGLCKDAGERINASPIGDRFDTVYDIRHNTQITLTPAIIQPTPTPVIPNNADQAGEILNCGFANADTTGKQKCCAPGIRAQEFNMDDSDISENCRWYDVECALTKRLRDYFVVKTQTVIDQKRNEYNTLLAENGGVMPECFVGTCEITESGERKCVAEEASAICERYIDDENYDAYSKCDTCMKQNLDFGKSNKFYSAIGCIDTSFEGIVGQVFTLGIGAAGMIALGCIIYSAFIMQTSMGNPEQLQKTQENVTSCITGLILIILSIFILRILGVDILRIPGFGG